MFAQTKHSLHTTQANTNHSSFWVRKQAGYPSSLFPALSLSCLNLVGEGHDAVLFRLVQVRCFFSEVMIPRTPHGLVDVAVCGGVEDLGHGHPVGSNLYRLSVERKEEARWAKKCTAVKREVMSAERVQREIWEGRHE